MRRVLFMPTKRIKLSKWNGEALPEPRKLTPEQIEAVVAWMAEMPVAEIRYRQSLCMAQMAALANRSDEIADRAYANQFVVWKQLAQAVGLQQCK